MTRRLYRLDLILRTYDEGDRWTWRLWKGSRIVSGSASQLYSKRSACINGAESGAGLAHVARAVAEEGNAMRYMQDGYDLVPVRVLDERGQG